MAEIAASSFGILVAADKFAWLSGKAICLNGRYQLSNWISSFQSHLQAPGSVR
jgi:hypothetical protein